MQEGLLVVAGMRDTVYFSLTHLFIHCCFILPCAGHSFAGAVTPQEEEELRRLTAMPNIYEVVAKSIAPSIYGSTDIKKAIACLLFGGSRKRWGKANLVVYTVCLPLSAMLCYQGKGSPSLSHLPTLLLQAPRWADPQRRHQLIDAG